MKSQIRHPLFLLLLPLLALLSACAGVVAAQGITAVSEIAASNALQKKALTVAQLNTLATDLGKLPGTPLPSSDNALIANLVVELLKGKPSDLTEESVIDATNSAINNLNLATSASPSALQGIAWADLQDVVGGLKQAVANAQANPQLVPQ